jgi:hypothetical protein
MVHAAQLVLDPGQVRGLALGGRAVRGGGEGGRAVSDAPFNGLALPPELARFALASPEPDPAEEAIILHLLAEDEE